MSKVRKSEGVGTSRTRLLSQGVVPVDEGLSASSSPGKCPRGKRLKWSRGQGVFLVDGGRPAGSNPSVVSRGNFESHKESFIP